MDPIYLMYLDVLVRWKKKKSGKKWSWLRYC